MTTPNLGQCPACQQWIELSDVPPTARLSCPWCGHLADPLQIQRPNVRPARLAEAPQTDPPAAGVDTANDPSPLDADETVEVPSPFQIGPAPVRPRAPSGNGYRAGIEFAKIVGGGLAGLAIAQMMLWWLPGIGRRDPLGLAQHVPPWLHVLVPPELRAPPPLPLNRPPDRSSARGSGSTGLPPLPGAPEVTAIDAHTMTAGKLEEAVTPAAMDCQTEAACQISAEPEGTIGEVPLAGTGNLSTAVMPAHAPSYSGEELQAAITEAATALDQLGMAAGGAREERAALARVLYQRLCQLAQVSTFAEPDGPYFGERMNAVDDLLRRMSRNESLLGLIGRTSAGWIAYPERTSDGIVLVGDVIRIQSQGSLWETELRLLSRAETRIRLLSMLPPPLDPRMPYETGQRLIVLGSVGSNEGTPIDAGAEHLPTVWRGLHYVIDPGAPPPAVPHDSPRRSRPVRF